MSKSNYPLYLLGIAFFFCLARYNGIVTDATLYTLQAVRTFQPERFVGDIAFIYGNQDSFTIFSPLYAAFLRLFSVDLGAKLFQFFSQLLFAFASIRLVDNWTKRFHCNKYFLPLALIFFLLYCNFGETRSYLNGFYYLESYVTPRTISVAFGLLGLSQLFKSKKSSLILFLVGTLFHPLMAGWGLPLWLFYHYPKVIFPISTISLLFPLTLFLEAGPFGVIDADWNSFYKKDHFFHFISFLAFFSYCWKFTNHQSIQKLSRAIFFTTFIAVYWLITGNKTNHIFLNQVQTFRIEWICIATTFPLFCFVLFEKTHSLFKQKTRLKITDIAIYLFPIIFWIDSLLLDVLLVVFVLCAKGISENRVSVINRILSTSQIIGLVAILFTVLMQLFSGDNQTKYGLQNYEFYTAYILAITTLIKLFLNKKPDISSIATLVVIFICNGLQAELRFTDNFSNPVTLLTATVLWVSWIPHRKLLLLVPLLWLFPFGVLHYDNRAIEQKEAESNINYYLANPLFPEIYDRGRFLFVVDGFYRTHPRLQFLSGAYLDYQSETGALFYRQQHMDAMHRFNMLFLQNPSEKTLKSWEDFSEEFGKLRDSTKLQKTALFLCKSNEISYVATDIADLDLPVVGKSKRAHSQNYLYLYGCDHFMVK